MSDRLGALPVEGGWRFCVFAPDADHVVVEIDRRTAALEPAGDGHWAVTLSNVLAGDRYRYRVDDGEPLPDPASRSQPDGPHGASAVVDPGAFEWSDAGWHGRPLRDLVIYELHVGTFSAEGTFDGVIGHLDELADLGVTAIEVMPIGEFPGSRNWGYDGVSPFAAQSSYGGPEGFRRLVDACHARGLAVVLDVVYNHLGPEGNHLARFGPYFTDRYRTPWGDAVNVDGRGSDGVRRFLVENALHWLEEHHVDALRLDAVHGIVDTSAAPFLAELSEAVADLGERLNRRLLLIAESDAGDVRLVSPRSLGGMGLDAMWADDFHHALHAAVTSELSGYYEDYGRLAQVAAALRDGLVYTGQHSTYRGRRHGSPTGSIPAQRFVVYSQNHDQVGNRLMGERLSRLVPFDELKLVAATVLLAPYVPLLFMGEEWGEVAPFPYFVSHTDPDLVESVRRGRREEFAAFGWSGEAPDPQSEQVFESARLNRALLGQGRHRLLRDTYRELIELRRSHPVLQALDKDRLEAGADEPSGLVTLRRWNDDRELLALFHFRRVEPFVVRPGGGDWRLLLHSGDERLGGPGGDLWSGEHLTLQPCSFAVLDRALGDDDEDDDL